MTTKTDVWSLGVLLYKLCFFSLPFGESALAIQGGQFCVPDHSKYSPEIHALIKYMLAVDPEQRPDIYCVSRAAFAIAGRECPVKNLHRSTPPDVKTLPLPPTESEWRHAKSTTRISLINNNNQSGGGGVVGIAGAAGGGAGGNVFAANATTTTSSTALSSSSAYGAPESTSVVPRERPKVAKTTTQSILMKVAERSPMAAHRNPMPPPALSVAGVEV